MPSSAPAPDPSSIQISTGKVRNRTGQALMGASASTDATPAANAMSARRQPHASTTEWASLLSFTEPAS